LFAFEYKIASASWPPETVDHDMLQNFGYGIPAW